MVTIAALTIATIFDWVSVRTGTFPVDLDGQKSVGVFISWDHWPPGVPWTVESTTNLLDINWKIEATTLGQPQGDVARMLTIPYPTNVHQ